MKPTLMLFTDGSVKRRTERGYCGYAYLLFDPKSHQYAAVGNSLPDSSILYCELTGVYEGLLMAEDKLNKRKKKKSAVKIVVVSDSKLIIQAFTDWIPNGVWDLSDYSNWRKADGTTVKCQSLYRKILKIISRNSYDVEFVHMNSHLSMKSPKDVAKVMKKADNANIKINEETAKQFIRLNSIVDELAQAASTEQMQVLNRGFKYLKHIKPND